MRPDALWYGKRYHPLSYLLLPLSWIYCAVVRLRRLAYRRGWLASRRLAVPVIVVGNLTVGGTGKTPLVVWLARTLCRAGRRPGIVTRGYGARVRADMPLRVTPVSDPREVGDEALLLARRSGCPVVVCPDRAAAAEALIETERCDMIVSDDGLQHYRLDRDLEIVMIDAERGLGNRRCLPAGPLREPVARMREADLTVCNGGPCLPGAAVMRLVPGPLVNLARPGLSCGLESLRGRAVTAVAGIGNPGRFFAMLRGQGLALRERPYGDHHRFGPEDAASWAAGPVIMTEKDAVKCEGFAAETHWYLPVEAAFDEAAGARLTDRVQQVLDRFASAHAAAGSLTAFHGFP